jgi:vesicle coat complex subunit
MCERFDPIIHRLVSKLDEPDPVVRRNALGCLRLHGPRAAQAAQAIARMLCDTDPAVRAEAERVLRLLDRQAA